VQADLAGVASWRRHLRLGQAVGQPGADVIPRLRAGLDHPAVFKLQISLEHGADADALLPAHLPHRRDAVARRVGSLADQFRQLVGYFLVAQGFGEGLGGWQHNSLREYNRYSLL